MHLYTKEAFMLNDYKLQALEKQQKNKYDNKNRRKEELRNMRLNLRISEKYYNKFHSMVKDSGLKQAEVFEQLLDRGYVQTIIGGKELAKNICEINEKLSNIQNAIYSYKDSPEKNKLISDMREIKDSYNKIKIALWESFKYGVQNGYIKS